MTKPKYREFYIADVTTQDHGEIPVAFKHHKNIKGSIHAIEKRALTDLQEQCDRLERALERLDAGFGGMFGGDGKDYYQDACDTGSQIVIEALAEYRKWKEE